METSRSGRRRRRRRRPSPAPESSSLSDLSWVLLDRFVHRKGDGAEAVDKGVLDGTRSNNSSSCTGVPIAVSLRAADPPAVSRLYIDWPEGFEPKLHELDGPTVVAAHRHSVLFQAFVPLIKDQWPSHCFPMDYFVYTAARSEKKAPASLRRLPACFIGGQVDSQLDNYYDPYRLQNQRMMCFEEIGLLCRGDDEFVVAELTYGGELCMLHHAPGDKDEAMQWSFKKLLLPHDKGAPKLLCGSWQTDTVIPFRDSYLCWIDFYLGLLFVDVLPSSGEFTKVPVHVPLPAVLDARRLYIDPGCPDPARHVCITDDGVIKIICIVDCGGRSFHRSYHSTFTIRVWSLIDFNQKRRWKEDARIEQNQFLAALDCDKRLPHIIPEFPVISMVDPDVICLRLNDNYHLLWLVELRMKKKVLGAIKLYIHEEEEEGRPVSKMKFPGYSFVPSPIVQFFDKGAIKSLELSNKLQKEKQEKNFWIEMD